MTNNYKIEIMKLSEGDGGGFLARVPRLPGCMSDGETYEEAMENIQDAIKCWIETAKELGRAIPLSDEYKDEDEFSGKLSLRIPKSLHKNITEQAQEEDCSINQLLTMYISKGIGNEFGKRQIFVNLESSPRVLQNLMQDKWDGYEEEKNSNIELNNYIM